MNSLCLKKQPEFKPYNELNYFFAEQQTQLINRPISCLLTLIHDEAGMNVVERSHVG